MNYLERVSRYSVGIFAFLMLVVEPTLVFAQPRAEGVGKGHNPQVEKLLSDTQKIDRLADELRVLGKYYNDRSVEEGIDVAREELSEKLESLTHEQIDQVRENDTLSDSKKSELIQILKKTLYSDLGEIAVATNLYLFFDMKARRLMDRDLDMVPFGPGDSIPMGLLEVFLWILVICSVVILAAMLVLAVSSPPSPCYHCHRYPSGRIRYCHRACNCHVPITYPKRRFP